MKNPPFELTNQIISAVVEIAELVGEDNIFTFGESSQTVIDRYGRADYVSRDYYEKDEGAINFGMYDGSGSPHGGLRQRGCNGSICGGCSGRGKQGSRSRGGRDTG